MGEPWVPPCSSCWLAFADELLDPADDVLDVELGRVDLHRVGRGHHSLCVALVADAEVGCERVGPDLGALGEPTLGPGLALGVQVDLHIGTGADDRADVAALDHRVTDVRELALTGPHDRPDRGMTSYDRHHAVDP